MYKITQNIYTFDELNNDAQSKAIYSIKKLISNSTSWREQVIIDGRDMLGIDISEYQLNPSNIVAKFCINAKESALGIVSATEIDSTIYSIAREFLDDLDELENGSVGPSVSDMLEYGQTVDELKSEYLDNLKAAYMLLIEGFAKEIETDEYAKISIFKQGILFYEDGRLYEEKINL
jgi:hypothetical protein